MKRMKTLVLSKPDRNLIGSIVLPSSKSISNRLLMMRAVTGSGFPISNLSEAADTVLLKRLLEIISSPGNGVTELDTGNAGTVARFLTAFLATKPGKWVITGSDRMKQRPVGGLVDALRQLGASIEYLAKPEFPPLLIRGKQLHGKEVSVDAGVSSQFITALLLIAPVMPEGLLVKLKGKPVSHPYTAMTVKVLQQAGIRVTATPSRIRVFPGTIKPEPITVEPDWSAAAFWYEAAALADEVVLDLEGLSSFSIQGDSILPDLFRNFGIQTEITGDGIRLTKFKRRIDGFYYDFTDYPDIAQAVIATCAGLGVRGRFEGVKSLQIKETDRLRAMKNEIEKLGIQVNFSGEHDLITAIDIQPGRGRIPGELIFETYGDHRTAMSLAPLAFKTGTLKIVNPEVVIKSYPGYWEDLVKAGFQIR